MLDLLPPELLIKIINYLNIKDVINLAKTKNKKIFNSCKYLNRIENKFSLVNDRYIYNNLKFFHNVKYLDIKNIKLNIGTIVNISTKNNWNLEKFSFWCEVKDSYNLYNFFKLQTNIKHLELKCSSEFNSNHFKILNKQIETLKLQNNNLCPSYLIYLNNFKNLKHLDLSFGTKIAGESLKDINLTNLEKLELLNCLDYMDEYFYDFLRRNNKIKKLRLEYNKLYQKDLMKINEFLPDLEYLSFTSIQIEDINNLKFKNKWDKLKTFICCFSRINDDFIDILVNNASNIEILKIDYTRITDIGVIYIILKLKNIRILSLAETDITKHSINSIKYNCENLRELDITGTEISIKNAKNIFKEKSKINFLFYSQSRLINRSDI